MPLNQSKIIGLPCKISKYYNWRILRKNYFCVLQWGYFHPAMHFQEVFSRYLWNGQSTLKIEENTCGNPPESSPGWVSLILPWLAFCSSPPAPRQGFFWWSFYRKHLASSDHELAWYGWLVGERVDVLGLPGVRLLLVQHHQEVSYRLWEVSRQGAKSHKNTTITEVTKFSFLF